MEKINKLTLPATILIASVILGGFYYVSQLSKQKSIEKQQQIEIQAKTAAETIKSEQTQIDLIEKNKLETQKSIEETLAKQQREKMESLINKCITDAYTELKTLQGNYDMGNIIFCSHNPQYCSQDIDYWNKAKNEALTTYKEEWVPQCKIGKRVFIHYESMTNN